MWFVPLKDMWGCHFAHRVEVTLYLNENQNSNTLCFPSLVMLHLLQVLKPHGQAKFFQD